MMPLVLGGLAAAGGLASGIGSWFAGNKAKSTMDAATKKALEISERNRQDLKGLYGEGTKQDVDKYAALLQEAGIYKPVDSSGLPGAFTGNVDVTKDPGYQFRMDEAQKALEAQQAKTGTLRSGFAAKDMAGYMQNLASNEYQNAYGREMATQNQEYTQAMSKLASDIQQGQFGSSLNLDALKQLYGGANSSLNNYAAALSGIAQNDLQTVMSAGSTTAQNQAGNNPAAIFANPLMGLSAGYMMAKK